MLVKLFFLIKAEPEREKPDSLAAQVFDDPKTWLLMMAAAGYLAGYVFIHRYLTGLGLPSNAHEVPVYALWVYSTNLWNGGGWLGRVALALPLLLVFTRMAFERWVKGLVAMWAALWVLAFALVFFGAGKTAEAERNRVLGGGAQLPAVTRMVPADSNVDFRSLLPHGTLYLSQNDEAYFFVRLPEDGSPATITLRKDDVRLLETMRFNFSSAP